MAPLYSSSQPIPSHLFPSSFSGSLENHEVNQITQHDLNQTCVQVTPVDKRYYGAWKCVAVNTHGRAEHEILLKEAFPPSEILQAKLEVITATTITFSFVGPANNGGLPTRAYAVQYKEERKSWNDASNKTWPVG